MTIFYIAGKWEEREQIREIQKALIEKGHEITCDWTYHEKDDPGYPVTYAVEDIEGVKNCDVYVGVFVSDLNYKGALVEMGAALATFKTVCIIGHAIDSCLFREHPLVGWYDTVEEFLEEW